MKIFSVKLNNKSKLVQKEQLGRRNIIYIKVFIKWVEGIRI